MSNDASNPTNSERQATGMKTRRAVLSDAYVDKASAGVSDFNRDWQDFITRTAWNDIWNRPGLSRRERSIIVLASTIALRHWDEFRIHLRGAVNNGLSQDEIREILMQSAIYAGVPSANHAFKEAKAFFTEREAEAKSSP
jgi:4-carboxymuconolactone decarboxylase